MKTLAGRCVRYWLAAVVVCWGTFAWQTSASAALEDDAKKVETAAAEAKLELQARQTTFIEEGHVLELPRTDARKCRSVVITATRNVSFTVVTGLATDSAEELMAKLFAADDSHRLSSESGLIQLGGCDQDARGIDRVLVRMLSPRGTLEARIAAGDTALGDLTETLGRAPGPPGTRGDAGPLLPVSSIAERRKRLEVAGRAEGATNVASSETRAATTGLGELTINAAPGCHRFHVLAEATEAQAIMDLDAELRDENSGARITRDRGETPDARLDACVGRATELKIVFINAPAGARVVVLDVLFPISSAIPTRFGDRALGSLTGALKKRARRGISTGPIFETMGAQGGTTSSFPVEAGRCYVVAVALTRGASRGLRVITKAGVPTSAEEAGPGAEAVSTLLCAERPGRAKITVEVPGVAIGWVALVWMLGHGPS